MRPARVLAPIVLAMLAQALLSPSAIASGPPPPPPGPGCKQCPGPPPPPTPVPTLAPTVVPQQQVVRVALSPTHVKRGHRAKLSVTAARHPRVTLVVRYRYGKATTYRATIGKSGTLVRRWTVPKRAPVGKASVRIDLSGAGKHYSTAVSFVVTR